MLDDSGYRYERAVEVQVGLDRAADVVLLHRLLRLGAELRPQLRVVGQLEQRGGQRGRVAGRDQQPGLAVGDDLGDAAGAARGDGQPERLRVEDRGPQPLGLRGEHEDVEHLQQGADVLAEPEEQEALPQPELAREGLDLLAQRAVADRHERDVGLLVQDEAGGAQQGRVVLVVGERRDGADHQVAARDAERAAEMRRGAYRPRTAGCRRRWG